MDYYWNNKSLEKRIRQLNRLKASVTSPQLKEQINLVLFYLNDSIEALKKQELAKGQTLSLFDRLLDEDVNLDPYYSAWKHVFQFVRRTKREDIYLGPMQSFSFSKDDIFVLTHDFYQDILPSSMLPFFQKTFKDRKDHIRFSFNSSNCGYTIYVPFLDETFIESQYTPNRQTLSDVITLIHEFAHAIFFQINYGQQESIQLLPFWEYWSLFIENIAFDYFAQIPTLSFSAVRDKQMEWACYKNDAYDLSSIFKILEMLDNSSVYNNRHLKLLVWQKLGISECTLEALLNSSKYPNFPYVVSYILIIELLTLYSKDKDMCWHIIFKILAIEADSVDDFYHQLLDLGIVLNEHTKEFDQKMLLERTNLPKL